MSADIKSEFTTKVALAARVDKQKVSNKIYRAEFVELADDQCRLKYLESTVDGLKQWAEWTIRGGKSTAKNYASSEATVCGSALNVRLRRYPNNAMEFNFDLDRPEQEVVIGTEYGDIVLPYLLHELSFVHNNKTGELKVGYEILDNGDEAPGTYYEFVLKFRHSLS